jgi:hypothetical protein
VNSKTIVQIDQIRNYNRVCGYAANFYIVRKCSQRGYNCSCGPQFKTTSNTSKCLVPIDRAYSLALSKISWFLSRALKTKPVSCW